MSALLQRSDGRAPRVLVAGGGVAALELLLGLRELAGMRVELEVIAPEPDLRYPPLEVVEPFDLAPPSIALADALATLDVVHHRDALLRVDVDGHAVHMHTGAVLGYEALAIAVGAQHEPARPGTLIYADRASRTHFAALVEEAEAGRVRHILFAVPAGTTWSLPLYELAVMTARRIAARGRRATEITIATPERMPLERFGPAASALVQEQLTSLGVAFLPSCRVERVLRGEARLAPEGRTVPADRVVTLPTLTGPSLSGLPHDAAGFVPVDAHGAVRDAADVYAAGDATDFPIKQGGLATQQADAVAEAIAARCGVPLTPAPFRPLLRGMLLTGAAPCYFETDLAGHHPGAAGTTPLWWPPLKVAGRRLAPFLAQQLGMGAPAPSSAPFSSRDELPAELAGSEDANLESG